MGNFMSCVLICGAMEVVQVVNTNGRVEKLIRPVRAAEIIWAHERYNASVATAATSPTDEKQQTKPPSSSSSKKEEKFVLVPLGDDGSKKAGIGGNNPRLRTRGKSSLSDAAASAVAVPQQAHSQSSAPFKVKKEGGVTTLIVSKRYLEQLLAEKTPASTATTAPATQESASSRNARKSSSLAKRPSIWRPALESISESNGGSSSGSSSSSSSSGGSSHDQHRHQHRHHRPEYEHHQGLDKF